MDEWWPVWMWLVKTLAKFVLSSWFRGSRKAGRPKYAPKFSSCNMACSGDKRKRLRASNPNSFNCIILDLLSYGRKILLSTPSQVMDLISRKIQWRGQTVLPPQSSCGSSPLLSLDESMEKAFPQLAYSSLHSPHPRKTKTKWGSALYLFNF